MRLLQITRAVLEALRKTSIAPRAFLPNRDCFSIFQSLSQVSFSHPFISRQARANTGAIRYCAEAEERGTEGREITCRIDVITDRQDRITITPNYLNIKYTYMLTL